MIELYIDNQPVEITPETSVSISASVEELTAPESIGRREYPLRIPMTPKNRAVMQFAEQTLSVHLFNQTEHPAEVRCKGTTLLRGETELVRCEVSEKEAGSYILRLIVHPPQWVSKAKAGLLRELESPVNGTFSPEWIRESWTSDSPVKFLPVKRDRYDQETIESLSFGDYHPFIQIKALLDSVVEKAGYRIESEFLNEPFFQSLYMSGNYPDSKRTAMLEMGFTALRTIESEITATAGNDKKIVATGLPDISSFGSFVGRAEATDKNKTAPWFDFRNGRPAFVPTQEVEAGFEYRFTCRFLPVIGATGELTGITALTVGSERMEIPPSPTGLIDKKGERQASGYYYACVNNHNPAYRYRVVAYNIYGNYDRYNLTKNNTLCWIYNYFLYAFLEVSINGGASYSRSDDWNLYSQTDYEALILREVEKEFVIRTPPKKTTPGETVFLDEVVVECTEPGFPVTLYANARVQPIFYASPAMGENIRLRDLFYHKEPQIKLIQAIGHLFDLHSYTDELTKTVYMEPRYSFLKKTHEIDWSDKIDPNQPILLEEIGSDRNRTETYLYKSGDGSLDRLASDDDPVYGSWSVALENRFAEDSEKQFVNPLFTASLDTKGYVENAPSASLVAVGYRDAKEAEEEGYLNFPAKIVRYLGMKELPEGETWGWPGNGGSYPLVMFHSASEDWHTLCFNDEEGQKGLCNYRLPQYKTINGEKKLTLNLRLTPSDIEAILHPNSAGHNFRGNFVFAIRGEKIRCRLAEVKGYDPVKNASTPCTFTVEF